MGPILAVVLIGVIIIVAMILYQVGGWGAVIGTFVGGFALLWFIAWLNRDNINKFAAKAQVEDSRKQQAAKAWFLASQRNASVKCKSCGKTVSELSALCPNCGEPLPGLRIQCPKCSSAHITVAKKGFNVGQAAAGGIALGPVGLAAGMIGAADHQFICLGCNHRWGLPSLDQVTVSQAPVAQHIRSNKPQARLKTPYVYREDIKKYRCEYCMEEGKYHYCKSLRGIKEHTANFHSHR